jgi:hypothetical protein
MLSAFRAKDRLLKILARAAKSVSRSSYAKGLRRRAGADLKAKLSRKSNQVARGRIRRFEPCVRSVLGLATTSARAARRLKAVMKSSTRVVSAMRYLDEHSHFRDRDVWGLQCIENFLVVESDQPGNACYYSLQPNVSTGLGLLLTNYQCAW